MEHAVKKLTLAEHNGTQRKKNLLVRCDVILWLRSRAMLAYIYTSSNLCKVGPILLPSVFIEQICEQTVEWTLSLNEFDHIKYLAKVWIVSLSICDHHVHQPCRAFRSHHVIFLSNWWTHFLKHCQTRRVRFAQAPKMIDD